MATSMQFGPEWMRKAPTKSNSNSAPGKEGAVPAPTGRSDSGAAAPTGNSWGAKRNGSLTGPAPVASPTVTSPGAFSFAAAAGGAAAAAAAAANQDRAPGTSVLGDGDAHPTSLSNGAVAKDKQSREKLLSLYSSDRGAKSPTSEIASGENGLASDKLGSAARKKAGLDREQRRPSTFSDLGAGSGPLSPSLGGEPRGLNARSTSGGSSGGFGSAGTSNWDRADKERPGLFQRASSSSTNPATNSARPISPSVSRDRFGGIQNGVLSGVAPPSRKRMDSEGGLTGDAGRIPRVGRSAADEAASAAPGSGSAWSRTGSGAAFSDAFSSNRPRTKPTTEGFDSEGGSISARFGRSRERPTGEGPIGPPADGSTGFNKFAGYDRKRERQASQARSFASTADPKTGTNGAKADPQHEEGSSKDSALSKGSALAGSDDADLSHHATSVLGSLKLDDDELAPPSDAVLGQDSNDLNAASEQAKIPAWSPDSAFWLYRDPSGQVQGPFAAVAMQDWYRQSYFTDDLLVKRQEDDEFRPLGQVIASIGNALQPFLIPPSDWLNNPDAPKARQTEPQPAISSDHAGSEAQSLIGAEEQDQDRFGRFAGQVDQSRGWPNAGGQAQQWPSQLNIGFGPNSPQPISPFGRPDPFGQATLDSRMRNQEDLVALMRERELQEQKQAMAAAAARGGHLGYGPLDPFVGGLARGGGWDVAGGQIGSNWMSSGGAPQFEPAFGSHGTPLAGPERQIFDAFNQRPIDQAAWAKGTSTPRSQFEQSTSLNRANPTQWDQQASWNMTPETMNRQLQEIQQVGTPRTEATKQFNVSDPIGTPRRARSPAPPSPQRNGSAEVAGINQTDASEAAKESTPDSWAVSDQQADVQGHPVRQTSESQPAPAQTESDVPEQETTQAQPSEVIDQEEPGPEQLWPQSPKAVEFASEPELPAVPQLNLNKKSGDALAKNAIGTSETKRGGQRQSAEVTKIPGAPEQKGRGQTRQTSSFSNVKVVSQEQFQRNKDAESTSASQVPLSALLSDGASEPQSVAPKPAPWAAREDSPSVASPGPSLREIQEAEARRAEARKAAERAAVAAQRAKAAALSAAGGDELPTSMSWGLASVPASKTNALNTDLGGLTSGSNTPSTPAWSAGKTAAPKKTLMEIQEEEKRRADKLKQQQAAQAMALRKGYADSASRTAVPSASSASGGAWSVVGSSGKPTPPPVSSSPAAGQARPAGLLVPRTVSVGSPPTAGSAWTTVGSKPAATASPLRTASQPAATPAVPSAFKPKSIQTSSVSLDPNQPSPEFIKYLKDNLKGLTIKADDFIEMLLSFPLDPSPDVIEIIAESVYANSSTLDGRRFAADFVAKRKMDVQGRQQQSGGVQSKWSTVGSSGGMGNFGAGVSSFNRTTSGSGPTMTAAEIMKSQASSKASADTLGGFKVVKAKGSKKRGN